MTQLIGIAGFKRSGKNTVADLISANYRKDEGATVVSVGFADKLKIAAMKAIGFHDRSDADLIALADSIKEGGHFSVLYDEPTLPIPQGWEQEFSGREYLQWFGTEAGRETFWDSFWIDLVLPSQLALEGWENAGSEALDLRYAADLVVITDVRFENEAQRIKSLGGKIWQVTRPGIEAGAHISEQPLPDKYIDVIIPNEGTINDLETKVTAALEVFV
jgi:hypothetical protein